MSRVVSSIVIQQMKAEGRVMRKSVARYGTMCYRSNSTFLFSILVKRNQMVTIESKLHPTYSFCILNIIYNKLHNIIIIYGTELSQSNFLNSINICSSNED